MVYEDWHTHNQGCHHARGTIEDYVKSGINFNLRTIGISDHFPYEFLDDIERIPYEEYAITLPEIEDYLSTSEGLRDKYKVIVGGSPTSEDWAEQIGADGWADDAIEAVELIKRIIN